MLSSLLNTKTKSELHNSMIDLKIEFTTKFIKLSQTFLTHIFLTADILS